MMDSAVEALIAALAAFLTSAVGFLSYLKSRMYKHDEDRRLMITLLMGLAQDRLIHQGMAFIERGWVTSEEYQDLRRYLYEPYHNLGGNGTVERIMHAVERLPFKAAEPLVGEVFRTIHIRESDPTGIPSNKPIPREEEHHGY